MIKGANKNREATIRCVAYAGLETVDIYEVSTRLTPSLVVLEFMERCYEEYPKVTAFEFSVRH